MMATTQVKEWGLGLEDIELHGTETKANYESSRDNLVRMMLRASFVLWSLGQLEDEEAGDRE